MSDAEDEDHYSTSDAILSTAKGLTALAWIVTSIIAIVQWKQYNDLANSDSIFDQPSAVQISQVADQAMVDVMPWFVASFALFVITILLAIRD